VPNVRAIGASLTDARIWPGAARLHRRAAVFSAPPRYPPSIGTASPASTPIPTGRAKTGRFSTRVRNARWSSTAGRSALTRRAEHTQSFVAAELDQLAVEREDRLACKLGEERGKPTGFLVAVVLRETRVATDISNQEGQDRGRRGPAAPACVRRLFLSPAYGCSSYGEESANPSARPVIERVVAGPHGREDSRRETTNAGRVEAELNRTSNRSGAFALTPGCSSRHPQPALQPFGISRAPRPGPSRRRPQETGSG
jgi:hypothetical protein